MQLTFCAEALGAALERRLQSNMGVSMSQAVWVDMTKLVHGPSRMSPEEQVCIFCFRIPRP